MEEWMALKMWLAFLRGGGGDACLEAGGEEVERA
jgi:hypothetical protein